MPLIRGIRAWFGRRASDAVKYAGAADGGLVLNAATWIWFFVFIVLIPAVAVLVLIGLIYELVIRIDGRRLGSQMEWLLSSAAGVLLVVGAYWVFVRH